MALLAVAITDPSLAGALHSLFEYGGMALGVALYRQARTRAGLPPMTAPGGFALMVGLLLGAGIGNKLAFAIERPEFVAVVLLGEPLRLGQSIVGGLLGGLLGIEIAKAWTRQPASTGDAMVIPLAAGIALGRVGCFLAGLHDDTYGLPTALPWAIDFGDGVPRHPSPLYEIAFLGVLATLLARARARLAAVPGLQFKLFLFAYLAWRLLGDQLKPVHFAYPLGLGGIQTICLFTLIFYTPITWQAVQRLSAAEGAASPWAGHPR